MIQEDLGGIKSFTSNGSLPRNINQAYNSKKLSSNRPIDTVNSSDPYHTLILTCKEESKDETTAFVRKINIAPEPVVVCGNNQQLNDLVKFCTKEKFTILQVDPTYNLGNFYVTTSQYENLLLLTKEGNVHPAMLGPILVHQKKEQQTYAMLSQFLCSKRPELRQLKCFGTDGETGLSTAFSDSCTSAIQLRCFIHFKKNIKEYMSKIGIDQFNQNAVCADLLGQQIGKCN